MIEQTVVLIKPDGMQKGYIGEVISRLEKTGFKLVAAKIERLSTELLENWYAHHKEKPFFPGIVSYMQEVPVLAMIWEGEDIIRRVREMAGVTDSTKAEKGTIRGDLGEDIQRNVVHISDSAESVIKEKKLLFNLDEEPCCEREESEKTDYIGCCGDKN